jgi:hypothetical protein
MSLDMGGKVAAAIEMGHGDDDIGEVRALWSAVLIGVHWINLMWAFAI